MAACSSGFPGRRVERVLQREGRCSPRDIVVAEGPFLQLSDDGIPERQVFLGVTSIAFIIVNQEIPSSAEPDKPTDDLEISDLVLSQVLPLPMVQNFIVDDKSKQFTVCTRFGHLQHYEMCQLDTNFEAAWTKWRQALIDIKGKDNCFFGFKSWNATSVASNKHDNKEFNSRSIAYETSDERPYYIHRPMSIHTVRSVGTQTEQGHLETKGVFQKFFPSEISK